MKLKTTMTRRRFLADTSLTVLVATAAPRIVNATLQQDLAAKGLGFNRTDPAPIRDKLRAAGFYTEWKGKYGDEAWSLLEKSVGKLA